jgi:hypothetical protein
MNHNIWWSVDGDYVIYHNNVVSVCVWMIPGSWMEDDEFE